MSGRLVCVSQRVKSVRPQGGRIFVAKDLLPAENLSLRKTPGILECLILSTCIRFEIYAAVKEDAEIPGPVSDHLRDAFGVDIGVAGDAFAVFEGADAVRHLFEVVCGLDSSIVGEKQIVGQVKEAYRAAQNAGCTGPVLNRLFQKCLNVSKRVRTRTGIDRGVCSAASLAVKLVLRSCGGLDGTRALILGAGQMGKLVALNLSANGCREIRFAARSEENARIVAEQCGAGCIPFSRFPEGLREVDILISATGAPHEVVGFRTVADASAHRGGRTLFIVDLADPPDVDPRVSILGNVSLFTLRCVDALASETKQTRLAAACAARVLIEESVGEFTRARDGAVRRWPAPPASRTPPRSIPRSAPSSPPCGATGWSSPSSSSGPRRARRRGGVHV